MKADSRITSMLLPAAAFVVSTYAVSSLMPLTLHILRNGLSLSNAALMAVDLGAAFISIWFLARVIYRIDKRAGRIRNRVGWFE